MFCAIIRREVIEKIGLLDERFFILGNDDDYCDRVRLSGSMTGVALNCFVYHRHGVTKNAIFSVSSPERAAIKRNHQALLREKRHDRATTRALG
jgi:GT2 family glycosyltransferase